jgi:GT2 family glycosyltransferase
LSVVVPSHDRPLRLRWLLNALAEQTLDRAAWEVVVCHDSAGPETAELLWSHPLREAGVLSHRSFEPGSAAAAAKRNAAVALARAPTIVFTDDDCRPPAEWLAGVLQAVTDHPGAIVQGPVAPDPDELVMLRSPFPRTQSFKDVPTVWAESCNIAYPRALVERLGGLAEDLHVGEDTDLCLRGRALGAPVVGDERMLTYHCVEEGSLYDRLREARRWSDLPLLVARRPKLRWELTLGLFWKREHALLALAAGGVAARRRIGVGTALALIAPWALARRDHGGGLRGTARRISALPSWALIDAAEMAVLASASARHRSLVL